jgi:hypothetical protein
MKKIVLEEVENSGALINVLFLSVLMILIKINVLLFELILHQKFQLAMVLDANWLKLVTIVVAGVSVNVNFVKLAKVIFTELGMLEILGMIIKMLARVTLV